MEKLEKISIAQALLNQYRISIDSLKSVLSGISDDKLKIAVDTEPDDKEFESIQGILTHTIFWGYYYIRMVEMDKGISDSKWTRKDVFETVPQYMNELDNLYKKSEEFLKDMTDKEITEGNPKYCDIEGVMDHAIVHIYRHKTQIEKLQSIL